MKYRALILDLDGTTVPNSQNAMPSARVTEAVHAARDRINVSIATGRPLRLAQPIIDHLKITGPCVINNGTQMYDGRKRKIISEHVLKNGLVPRILDIATQYRARHYLFDGLNESLYKGQQVPEKVVSVFSEDLSKEDADAIIREIEKIRGVVPHKIVSWYEGRFCVEVTNALATKQHGIYEIAKIMGVDTKDMIGVGDGYNDFPLLMACGLKIAMGNAIPELKSIADFVAPSVEEDGVAVVIEKFILGK